MADREDDTLEGGLSVLVLRGEAEGADLSVEELDVLQLCFLALAAH